MRAHIMHTYVTRAHTINASLNVNNQNNNKDQRLTLILII